MMGMTITILTRAVELERALGELRLNRDTHLLSSTELFTGPLEMPWKGLEAENEWI